MLASSRRAASATRSRSSSREQTWWAGKQSRRSAFNRRTSWQAREEARDQGNTRPGQQRAMVKGELESPSAHARAAERERLLSPAVERVRGERRQGREGKEGGRTRGAWSQELFKSSLASKYVVATSFLVATRYYRPPLEAATFLSLSLVLSYNLGCFLAFSRPRNYNVALALPLLSSCLHSRSRLL